MEGDPETEKLLQNRDDIDEEEDEVKLRGKIWAETKKMWIIAGPAIISRFFNYGISVVTQAFIGHIGSIQLAAFSLDFTVLLRFATGVLLGMACALETVCGQSYGAKQYHVLGIYLQRCWIILFTSCLFLLPLLIFTTPILMGLGQDQDIARVAGNMSLWLIPVLFSYVPAFSCQMFLQAQSKNIIIAYLDAFSFFLHLLLSWLLIVKYKFGVPGAMVSTIFAFWIPNFGQLLYAISGACTQTWKGFSMLAFKDLWPFLKLSLSSGVMLGLELWYNSVLILLTGKLKNAEISIDALSICLNINGWALMISLGFFTAASVRVSNELGRGSSKAAKFSIVNMVVQSFVIGLVLLLIFLFMRGKLAYFFTESEQVADAVADLSPLLAFSILMNSIQQVLSGVVIGAGWQTIVAYVNIICYYLIGIPVAVVLGYVVGLQVKGVWIGMIFGIFVQTVALIIITIKTDWEKQISLAQNRVNKLSLRD